MVAVAVAVDGWSEGSDGRLVHSGRTVRPFRGCTQCPTYCPHTETVHAAQLPHSQPPGSAPVAPAAIDSPRPSGALSCRRAAAQLG